MALPRKQSKLCRNVTFPSLSSITKSAAAAFSFSSGSGGGNGGEGGLVVRVCLCVSVTSFAAADTQSFSQTVSRSLVGLYRSVCSVNRQQRKIWLAGQPAKD